MKCSFLRSLIITETAVALFMVVPSQAMFYRVAGKMTPIKSTSLQKNLTQRVRISQQRVPIQQRLMLLKKQRFNSQQSFASPKRSWSSLLAALGLGWLWYNPEDEEKSEEKTTEKYIHISFDQFVKKFAPPKEIQETIEAHKDALSPRKIKPYLIKGTQPPVYHKWDLIDRIINAELLREVIKQNNLDIEIPKKYVYPNPNNGKYEVFAQGVPVRSLGTERLTLKEVQALIKLTVESGYADFNKDNVFRDPQNNKLIIIDTENASFLTYNRLSSTGYQIVNQPKKACVRSAIYHLNHNFKIDRNAQAWAVNYANKLSDSEEGEKSADLYTSDYNKLNISAQNAEELEREFRNQNQGQEGSVAKAFKDMKHAIWSRK